MTRSFLSGHFLKTCAPVSCSAYKFVLQSSIALLMFFNTGVQAQNEGRWYNVELLIFKRLGVETITREYWRSDLTLNYPDAIAYLNDSVLNDDVDPASGIKNNLGLLPKSAYQLGNYYDSLRKNPNYQPLFYQAWQQQMQNKSNSPAIIIRGGEEMETHKELEGTITLHIARYLHLTTDLWLSADNISSHSYDDNNGRQDHVPPAQTDLNKNINKPPNGLVDTSTDIGDANKADRKIIVLRQHRRMRSKELHYIDHPLMGILLFITPIQDK